MNAYWCLEHVTCVHLTMPAWMTIPHKHKNRFQNCHWCLIRLIINADSFILSQMTRSDTYASMDSRSGNELVGRKKKSPFQVWQELKHNRNSFMLERICKRSRSWGDLRGSIRWAKRFSKRRPCLTSPIIPSRLPTSDLLCRDVLRSSRLILPKGKKGCCQAAARSFYLNFSAFTKSSAHQIKHWCRSSANQLLVARLTPARRKHASPATRRERPHRLQEKSSSMQVSVMIIEACHSPHHAPMKSNHPVG